MQKIGFISSFNGYKNGIHALFFNCRTFQRLFSASSSINQGNIINYNNNCSSIANFLVESLAFSTHQSLSTCLLLSKRRQLTEKSKERDIDFIKKATCVVQFLQQQGFQLSDIKKLIIKEPRILVSGVDRTLKPKIKLLSDLGFSGSELILTVTRFPRMLIEGLGPAIHTFKTVFGSDKNVIIALKRSHGVCLRHIVRYLIPNVELLRNDYGIALDKIQKHIPQHPKFFILRPDYFRDKLVKVEEKLGIARNSGMFLYGLHLACFSEKCIEDKRRVFRSFGWTKSEVNMLIRKNPMCLASAQSSIKERLDFLMKQLDYKSNYLALRPTLFTYSVKKRLLPRHRVLEFLKERGLIRMDYSLVTAASMSQPYFLKKFVLPFEEVRQVYSQLTGSTVGSFRVGKHEG